MEIKAGDTIRYTSAAGTQTARVNSITIGPTRKPDHSIAWMNLTVFPNAPKQYESQVRIAADAASLKMFKVEIAN